MRNKGIINQIWVGRINLGGSPKRYLFSHNIFTHSTSSLVAKYQTYRQSHVKRWVYSIPPSYANKRLWPDFWFTPCSAIVFP